MYLIIITVYIIMGNFREVQNFAFLRAEHMQLKNIKTRRNSHIPVFHMHASSWWVWFPGIEIKGNFRGQADHEVKRNFLLPKKSPSSS